MSTPTGISPAQPDWAGGPSGPPPSVQEHSAFHHQAISMLVILEAGPSSFNIDGRSGVPPGMSCRLLFPAGDASGPSQNSGRDAEPFGGRPCSGAGCRCMGRVDEDLRIRGCPCTPQSGSSSAMQESSSMSTAPAGQNARDEACAVRRLFLSHTWCDANSSSISQQTSSSNIRHGLATT